LLPEGGFSRNRKTTFFAPLNSGMAAAEVEVSAQAAAKTDKTRVWPVSEEWTEPIRKWFTGVRL
jgi:hypothetical protein